MSVQIFQPFAIFLYNSAKCRAKDRFGIRLRATRKRTNAIRKCTRQRLAQSCHESPSRMRQANNGAGDKKNISKHAEEQGQNQASREDEQAAPAPLSILSEKDKSGFQKFRKRAC